MTILEMANCVCGKVNQTEAEDVTACKGFLRRRHEMLYQDQLWRDAVGEYVQTLSPDADDYTVTSNWLPAKGILLLPPDIERVLAVRTDTRSLKVRSREFYYRRDFDSFAQRGTAGEFVRLRPCVWEWETAQAILAKRAAGDATLGVTADLADSDGVGITRYTKTLDEDYKLIGTSERIEALTKAASADLVYVGAPGVTTLANNNAGLEDPLGFAFAAASPISPPALQYTIAYGASASVTPDNYVTPVAISGPPVLDPTAVPGGAYFGGVITNDGGGFTFARATPSGVTLAAADTAARKRQRIRLIELPDAALTIRVLAKLVCPSLSADGDAPALTNVDNCLMAFAQGDMLQRERQYGKAQAAFAEGVQLLDQLKRVEVIQEAHNLCIQPDGGYAAEYDHRGNLFTW
jgi:hypothetical protein